MKPFLSDIQKIRDRARSAMSEGAVTSGLKTEREQVIRVLNEVLATELVCILRYKHHYYMAKGIHSESVREEFLAHAREEQEHADWVAERIVQLNGKPDFNPVVLAERSHSEYVEGGDLVTMIEEDLVAERIAIETYLGIVRWLGNEDPTTRGLIERILAKEEEHAEDLSTLLEDIPRRERGRRAGPGMASGLAKDATDVGG